MPSKAEEYLALAQRTANGLTRYWESWTDYLTTASRLYKYPFADQLMIYAQRPDATACAEFDIWRNRMNRYVRRGSKGIALLDESSGFPRLHYVFDVSDTGVRRNSRDPEVWQLGPDLVQPGESAGFVQQGDALGTPAHITVHPVVPDVKVGAGGGIRALGVDHKLVGKGVLVQPGCGGQVVRPAFPVPGQAVRRALGKCEVFFGFAWHFSLLSALW